MEEIRKFEIGDPVWAKMKSYPTWPAKIVDPVSEIKRPIQKKPMACVYFFGSHNYAWVLEECIWPYEEKKQEYMKKKKSAVFRKAVEELEDFIARSLEPADISSSSSEDDLVVLFPSSSNKMYDYTRTPFLSKPKLPALKKRKRIASSLKNNEPPHTLKTLMKASRSEVIRNFRSPGVINSFKNDHFYNPVSEPRMIGSSYTQILPRSITKSVNKNVSKLKFGFIGLGIMGRAILRNILKAGHHVTVWNRTQSKCEEFVSAGAIRGKSPAHVVATSDITFCCVSTPKAVKEIVFGKDGVLQAMQLNKGFVDITSVDLETSQDLSEAVSLRGGRYLESPVCRSTGTPEKGSLIILGAGDRSLFNDCSSCFLAMGDHAFYLGEVGNACKMNLVISMLYGTMLAGLAEAMALADRTNLSQPDMIEVLKVGALSAPVIIEKGRAIIDGTYPTQMPLQHMQKDLHLALGMGDQLDQSLPLTAAANEVYKHAKRLSYGEHDVSAVYIRARH